MPAPNHSVFYRPDALPAAQPTSSKHWRHIDWPVQWPLNDCCCCWSPCKMPIIILYGISGNLSGKHTKTRSGVFLYCITHTGLTALCPGLPGWAGTRKVKPIWILLKQEAVGGSGISWAICKSAPHCRQITMPAPHYSVFTGRMPFLPPNQQRQSSEGKISLLYHYKKIQRAWSISYGCSTMSTEVGSSN